MPTVPLDYFKLFYLSSYNAKPYNYNPEPLTRAQKDATANEERTSFHSLPKELRDEILGLVLLDSPIKSWDICLGHCHASRGGCAIDNARFSPERLMFSALVLVSPIVRTDAIDIFTKSIMLSCWMPLSTSSASTPRVRTCIEPYCVCPLLLRHATKLQIRRGYEETPGTFDVSVAGDESWQVDRPDTGPESRELRKLGDNWVAKLQKLLQDHDVQGRLSKTNLKKLYRCLEEVRGASTPRKECEMHSRLIRVLRRNR